MHKFRQFKNWASQVKRAAFGSKKPGHLYMPSFNYKDYVIETTNWEAQIGAYKSWVFVCASRNARTFAQSRFRLYTIQPRQKPKTIKVEQKVQDYIRAKTSIPSISEVRGELYEITEHPLLSFLRSVNPHINETELKEITQLGQELAGNGYWYVLRNYRGDEKGLPKEIWPLRPDWMRVIPDNKNFIGGYVYLKDGMQHRAIHFKEDEIIHFKMPSPSDPYYGVSPLVAVAQQYILNESISKYETALFKNMGRPEGYIRLDEEADDAVRERLKTEWQETYSGSENVGKTPVLQFADYKPFNISPRDLSYLQGRKWTKTEIYEAYDNPEGLFDPTAIRANADAAQYTYMKMAIMPRLLRFEEKLNEKLVPMFGENLFLVADNPIPEDKEFALKRDVEYVRNRIWTTNEVRRGQGREPIEGGDELVPTVGQSRDTIGDL